MDVKSTSGGFISNLPTLPVTKALDTTLFQWRSLWVD
jgi:hypothetical protein